MLQPLEPFGSSFPSGDALQIWYPAFIVPVAAGNATVFLTAAISLAILVTLGRMVMLVHYLTDTLAGRWPGNPRRGYDDLALELNEHLMIYFKSIGPAFYVNYSKITFSA